MIISGYNAGAPLDPVTRRGFSSNGVLPTYVAGDLLVAITPGNGYLPGAATGWTTIAAGGGGNGTQMRVQWKIASAGQAVINSNGDYVLYVAFAGGKSIGAYSAVGTVYAPSYLGVQNISLHNTDGSSQVMAWFAGQTDVIAIPSTSNLWTSLYNSGNANLSYAKNTAVTTVPSVGYAAAQYSNVLSFEVKNTA